MLSYFSHVIMYSELLHIERLLAQDNATTIHNLHSNMGLKMRVSFRAVKNKATQDKATVKFNMDDAVPIFELQRCYFKHHNASEAD